MSDPGHLAAVDQVQAETRAVRRDLSRLLGAGWTRMTPGPVVLETIGWAIDRRRRACDHLQGISPLSRRYWVAWVPYLVMCAVCWREAIDAMGGAAMMCDVCDCTSAYALRQYVDVITPHADIGPVLIMIRVCALCWCKDA